jgi:electron transport complex protein RnfB
VPDSQTSRVAAIDALLPQTQCTRCGFDGCLPYAEALAAGQAALNRCPPGGSATIASLAALLDRPALPLDQSCGRESPPLIAWIDPERCIGCARCLPPCPTDAIIGARRWLHTVIVEDCMGCELCVAICPADCIVIRPRAAAEGAPPSPDDNRSRYHAHRERAQRRAAAQAELIAERKRRIAASQPPQP